MDTGETFNDDLAMTQVHAMAAKGFVAATVEYSSGSFGSCSAKTKCIFNGSRPPAPSRADGSGWYIVKAAEVSDGEADHCYMLNGGCTSPSGLDNGFKTGSCA